MYTHVCVHGISSIRAPVRPMLSLQAREVRRCAELELATRVLPAAFVSELRPLQLVSTNGVKHGWPRAPRRAAPHAPQPARRLFSQTQT